MFRTTRQRSAQIRSFAVGLLLALGGAGGAVGQDTDTGGNDCPEAKAVPKFTIDLDDTGIASWRYINKRRPLPLAELECLSPRSLGEGQEADVRAYKEAMSEDFKKDLTVKKVQKRILKGLDPLEEPDLSDLTDEKKAQVRKLIEEENKKIEDAWNQGAKKAEIEFRKLTSGRAFVVEFAYKKTGGSLGDIRKAIEAELKRLDIEVSRITAIAGETDSSEKIKAALESLRAEVEMMTEASQTAIESYQRKATKGARRADRQAARQAVEEASADALERKWEPYVKLLEAKDFAGSLSNLFTVLKTTLETARSKPSQLEDADETCEDENGLKQSCTYSIFLFGSEPRKVPAELLETILDSSEQKETLTFTVRFFDGVGTPANDTGYLRAKVGEVEEPSSETSWEVSASVGWREQPQIDSNPDDDEREFISSENPYQGASVSRYRGSGQLKLGQTLRSIAEASATLAFKSGDLGEADQTRDVEVSTYTVDLFFATGVSLRFGKFAFASPADSIAISESGEGFQFNIREFSLGYAAKRESRTGALDDSGVWIARYEAKIAKDAFDFYYLQGEEHGGNQRPYDYTTYGFDATGSGLSTFDDEEDDKGWSFFLKGSYFWSERRVDEVFEPDPSVENFMEVTNAEGEVGLAEVIATRSATLKGKDKPQATRTFSLRYGQGDGDDPATPDIDEGYLGEGASFAPDRLFLSTFAGVARDTKTTIFPAIATLPRYADRAMADIPTVNVIGPGLSNKKYWGLTITEQRYLPLTFFARNFKNKVQAESLVLRWHRYEFVREVFSSRSAGTEISLEWNLQWPRGVQTTVWWAEFNRGAALEPIFDADPETFGINVSLTLK